MMVTLHHRPHRQLLDTDQSRASPANNEANLDANMVIILAVLLCALGLNLIIRCALRCGRRFAFGTPDEAENARLAATTGLKKSALWWIPVAPYRPGLNIPATDCPICLGEFVDGEKVRVLPNCNHGFHVRCIDIWLVSHLSCPTCRHSLLDNPTGSDVVDDGILQNHGNAPGGGGGGGGGSGQGDVQVVGVDE